MNERRRPHRKNLLATIFFGLVWCSTLAIGLRTLLSYETTPGSIGEVGQRWPSASRIPAPNERPTLVMVAHPQCPCTRASMDELAKVMARLKGKVSAYVLFLKPRSVGADWENTELCRSAAKIPGVNIVSDIDGIEARKFGAETSGHTFLYDREGKLLFSGGITQSRGHAGDNAGESAIISFVNKHESALAKTFVFGCSLIDRQRTGEPAYCLK